MSKRKPPKGTKHLKRVSWCTSRSPESTGFSYSPGSQSLSSSNISYLSLLLTCLDRLMADTNCSSLQKNSKGEKIGNKGREKIVVTDPVAHRESHDLHSSFTKGQRVLLDPWSPTSQVRFSLKLHRCQEASKQRAAPAGWQRLLLGFLKTELWSLNRARGCGESVTGPAFNQCPFITILQQRLNGSGKPEIHFKPSTSHSLKKLHLCFF